MTTHNFLSDQPSTEDAFNRRTFAQALSCALCLPKGALGLVVGIEGEWGSGKSTVIGWRAQKPSATFSGDNVAWEKTTIN